MISAEPPHGCAEQDESEKGQTLSEGVCYSILTIDHNSEGRVNDAQVIDTSTYMSGAAMMRFNADGTFTGGVSYPPDINEYSVYDPYSASVIYGFYKGASNPR